MEHEPLGDSRLTTVCPRNGVFREITVSGNGMLPLYRHGDQLLVDDMVSAKCGDRVVVESGELGFTAGTLIHLSKDELVIAKGGQASKIIRVLKSDATYLGRIVWASQ